MIRRIEGAAAERREEWVSEGERGEGIGRIKIEREREREKKKKKKKERTRKEKPEDERREMKEQHFQTNQGK